MKISVFAIIEFKGKFLLIRESNPKWKNKWFFPGGKSKEGESFIETAMREVKEEAGYDIAINGLTLIRVFGKVLNQEGIRIFLSGRITGGDIKKDYDEHSKEAGWYNHLEISLMDLREDITELLLKNSTDKDSIPTAVLEII